jgi:Co/Zn/Cd efflux system component
MSAQCCGGNDHQEQSREQDGTYRRVLWFAFAANAAMFVLEIAAGVAARSVSLQADAIDFLADAANYLVSLAVLGMALRWRARAALAKGATMGLFGLWVLGSTVWHVARGTVPAADIMGIVGLVALATNVGVAVLLFRYRKGDANRMSVWICSRNDAIGNLAVLLAAAGVFGTGTGWPDVVVAAIMATLGVSGAYRVIGQARGELRAPREAHATAA